MKENVEEGVIGFGLNSVVIGVGDRAVCFTRDDVISAMALRHAVELDNHVFGRDVVPAIHNL